MEKQVPSILDPKPVFVLERGVHFAVINTALRTSFPQNDEEETFWGGFTGVIKKTQKAVQQVLTVLFCSQRPSPVYSIKITKQGITTAQDVHLLGAGMFY